MRLYLARVNVTEPKEALNIGFLSHYPFLQTLSTHILNGKMNILTIIH